MVSNIRHLQLHDSLLETKRRRLVIVNFPDSFRGIPFTARQFDPALQFGFLKFNPQSDNLWLLRRRPGGFFDDDFDGGAAFAPLLVVTIADPRPTVRRSGRGTSLYLSDREPVSAVPAEALLLDVGEKPRLIDHRLSLRRRGV